MEVNQLTQFSSAADEEEQEEEDEWCLQTMQK